MATKNIRSPGRPRLASDEARNERLVIRLNQAENETIEDASERATGSKRKKSEWAREVLLTEAKRPASKPRKAGPKKPV